MLAERYPNAKGSRQAAKIAMASWQQAGQQATGEARDQALAKAAELAGIVMKTWPDEPESADAAVIAIGAAVSARDAKAIASIIEQVPAGSPRKAEVQLRAGMALWREVQEARRREEGDRPAEATIAGWRATAAKALDEGIAGLGELKELPAPPMGQLAVAGALSRVQIAMEDDDDARATALMQHPVYGPWTLVTGNNPLLKQGTLAEAALTLGLRLFIQTEDFDKAQQAMTGLEKVAGQGDEASAKLTAMYLSMGRDLQGQLESLGSGEKAASPEVRKRAEKILTGFEKFLDGVAARDSKTSSQMWVATTYLTLGSGKGTGAVVPPSQASAYLKKSAEVYQKLLSKADNPEVKNFEPSIRLKMATIYQVLADWDEAQKQMDWILADPQRQNSLEAQLMAAEVLQAAGMAAAQAGDAEKANTLLREAASGRKTPPVVIWGWGNIANKVARQGIDVAGDKGQQNRDTFFDARLRVAECLVARARLPGKEKERPTRLDTAQAAIAMTRKLYPDLGGETFAKRYEQVLKKVQSEKGEKPDGFQALDAKAQAAAAAAQETTGATP
jgi:tetratricopeptide (TPR) repeat protein